ncbi:uncharacterized protein MONOS_15427 [Monocercomonoides exilis]|uniref:uncharacterized protein n=1 Tax=Monocercomonoides exilis TaxID=2049356 RepID=UPI00355AA35E|nr:hypothetical protein MONOS_15427 [Monocercomonoides exilis]|eukprot:MONOS_15427.1-p1 / transcript=MONOS_15427.1 / gene=MONOS_15427 / organism=Monocercomonoides_exilis_PA203 / gene_product=unspecified product / transcript_product=unspecified product / location=Mono_scaffold01229:5971-7418(-) / protein_length=435 / sequence_SO=supercontig / SO=protein_coding / is_pseudo=false
MFCCGKKATCKMNRAEKYTEMLFQLRDCSAEEQTQRVGEMNSLMDQMGEDEMDNHASKVFEEFCRMIEEKKVSLENTISLMKRVGYANIMRSIYAIYLCDFSLKKKIESLIFEEGKKNDEKNEKLLIEMCECCGFIYRNISPEIIPVYVPCMLNAALKKEESEETRKEVEDALLALNYIEEAHFVRIELFQSKIKEIIMYHQEHRNLTHMGYRSAWHFYLNRLLDYSFLGDAIVNELHFVREAARELEELSRSVRMKKKEGKVISPEFKYTVNGWLETVLYYRQSGPRAKEDYVPLVQSMVCLRKAARGIENELFGINSQTYELMALYIAGGVEDLLKGGVFEAVLEEMQRDFIENHKMHDCYKFFLAIQELKMRAEPTANEAQKKEIKMKLHEKLEEEGFEDILIGNYEVNGQISNVYCPKISVNVVDYLVYI